MNRRYLQALMALIGLAAMLGTADAANLPRRVGECVETRVKEVANRLENTPGSGSAIDFVNGGYQVSYDQVPEVDASRPGDPVAMCLVSIPRGCPPGDQRGRRYRTTNKRTGQSWTLPDAEHMCGGA
ncbi:hypothetical protein SAMN05444161_5052 [Rhizobiales bacterium GAS191]|nr:hypothetical protein SAMN05444161_5052 [Rhizobiales bacterium GAS191]